MHYIHGRPNVTPVPNLCCPINVGQSKQVHIELELCNSHTYKMVKVIWVEENPKRVPLKKHRTIKQRSYISWEMLTNHFVFDAEGDLKEKLNTRLPKMNIKYVLN